MQGLRVFVELLEVRHVDGKAQRRLLTCGEGLKWSRCCLRIPAYGHFKVEVYNFDGTPHFRCGRLLYGKVWQVEVI
jgi:hypothetical protein